MSPLHAVSALCALGHTTTTAALRTLGSSAGAVRRAVEEGSVVRVRRGVYACAHLDAPLRSAAASSGLLACVSVLRERGVWVGFDRRTHLTVPPGRTGVTVTPDTRLHWRVPLHGLDPPLRVSRREALWQAMRCLPEEHAIAALESAVRERFLPEEQVVELADGTPRRLLHGVRLLDLRSQSGNETITRLRLLRAGHHVVSQPWLPGVGHGDLLVDDVVGLDIDSRKWHGEDRFEIDRERDLRSEELGRRALRLAPSHIHRTWPHTLAVIKRVVRDALRERGARAGRPLRERDGR